MAFAYKNPITITSVGTIVEVVNMIEPGSVSGGWSVQGGRTYSVSLRVKTNNRYVGPIQVIQSLNLQMGNYYQFPMGEWNNPDLSPTIGTEKDQGSFLNSVEAQRQSDDALTWVVTMGFSPHDLVHEQGDDQIRDGAINPIQRRPEVSWGSAKYQFSHYKDLDGLPFVNTAGEPLQDVPQYDENRPLLTIIMNREAFDPIWVNQFKDSVNFDEFLGFPPNKVKCRDITADQEWDADYGMFWKVKYEFEIKDDSDIGDDGFTTVILNTGYREKTTVGASPTEVMIGGKPVSEPVLLNQDGKYVPGADPHYLEFHVLTEKYFADLQIPDDVLTRTT